ncbi:cyclase family protein [Actinophytocola sp.]|uniref:cyclase family protein n=1 Tax=Actinophytocola sp. TaxID=1872138 RepID=UPI003D6A8B8B
MSRTAANDTVSDEQLVAWIGDLAITWAERSERGTLNFVDVDCVRRAAAAVRDGITVSCARTISPKDSTPGNPIAHFMLSSGDDAPVGAMGSTTDVLTVAWHGRSVTHLDALSHIAWDRRLYGGASVSAVTARRGATVGSVEAAADGIVGRGVLCDLAGYCHERGERLPPVVPLELVEATLAAQGCDLRGGDIVLVRFGRPTDASRASETDAPGLHPEVLPWIHENRLGALGTDEVADPLPGRAGPMPMPIHAVGIVAMGLWIMDNLVLERVAELCRDRREWTFLFSVAPLRIRNGTGSPINPVAVL